MKRPIILAAALLSVAGIGAVATTAIFPLAARSAAAPAAARTATFAIQNMTCATCPITVKKAIQGVKGVKSVSVDFDAKTATVTFDPSVTNVKSIATASTNAGYPASVAG